ncbi:YfcE family phosphodiesterase [Streptomyces sp. P9-A2]|uniref:YfcE family phosphodiesterase n=1 Tax=Streptomyces sp. P9-A2 TaxID=3072284 RepID=UPI002FCAB0BD
MRLLLVSDTHVPLRAKRLPSELLDEMERADVVVHAGDWVDAPTLDLLEARARRLIGVFGNNDGPELRERLPEVARAELGGLRFGVVHETGPARGREARCAQRFPDLDVLVFGHSHIPYLLPPASEKEGFTCSRNGATESRCSFHGAMGKGRYLARCPAGGGSPGCLRE